MKKAWILLIILILQDYYPALAARYCNTSHGVVKRHFIKKHRTARIPCGAKEYVSFNYGPLPGDNCISVFFSQDDFYDPDLSTGDDDASTYPDMDIYR